METRKRKLETETEKENMKAILDQFELVENDFEKLTETQFESKLSKYLKSQIVRKNKIKMLEKLTDELKIQHDSNEKFFEIIKHEIFDGDGIRQWCLAEKKNLDFLLRMKNRTGEKAVKILSEAEANMADVKRSMQDSLGRPQMSDKGNSTVYCQQCMHLYSSDFCPTLGCQTPSDEEI